MKKAIFLDKDGTLVDNSMYPLIATDDILPGVFEGLKWIKDNTDYLLFIVSNQSFISKGTMIREETEAVFKTLCFKLNQNGIKIEEYVYCPHKSGDNCDCRKPKTFLVDELVKKYGLSLSESFVIGDSCLDQGLAKNLGTKFIAVKNNFTTDPPNFDDESITLIIDNFTQLINSNIF